MECVETEMGNISLQKEHGWSLHFRECRVNYARGRDEQTDLYQLRLQRHLP